MELTWKQLLSVMKKIADQAIELTDVAKRLHAAITHEKVREIGELVIEQETKMKVFQEFEQEREALVQSLGQAFHIPKDQVNAAALQPHIPPAWSNDYRLHVEQLKKAMAQVKQANEINQKLLNHSRQFMSWLINYLVTPTGSSAMYNASGINIQNSSYHVINQNM